MGVVKSQEGLNSKPFDRKSNALVLIPDSGNSGIIMGG